MSDGIFIKVLPTLELAAFQGVITQLKGLMSKAGADMSKSFDGPQKSLEKLNATAVETANTVAKSQERLNALQEQSMTATQKRQNVEATANDRQLKAQADIETAEMRLDATRAKNFASQESRMASLTAGQARLDAAVSRSAQVQRDEALAVSKALGDEAAAMQLLTKQNEDVAAARALNTKAISAQNDAMIASSGFIAKHGEALNTMGMAATGAFAIIGGVGIDAATKFETGMTRMQVAAQMSAGEVQKLSQGLLDMSGTMGVHMDQLQQAALMIGKAGPQYKNAADQLAILKQGIELSKTEGADLTTVVQQMTTSMTDFSMGAGAAGNVAAMFQTAAANAKRPLEEFVGALHNIEPAAMGVLDNKTGLPQVLTLLSQMAGTGAGIDQASQNLNNFLSHLNVPNAPQRSVLGALGLDSTALSEQLKAPNGAITVLGELRAAIAAVTTGTGDNAITHLGEAFKNPQVEALMKSDYSKLSPFQKGLADRFQSANEAGLPVDKDTMRSMRAAAGTSGLLKDWYTKFLQTTGPSNLVKAGIDPNMSPAMAVQYATGSQAGDRSYLGIVGDPSNPDDPHWKNTQETLANTTNSHPDKNGDVPGWTEVLKTNKQKLEELNGSLQKLAIEVGNDLLPSFKTFVDMLSGAVHIFSDNKTAIETLLIPLGLMATAWTGIKVAMGFQSVFNTLGSGIDMAVGKFAGLTGAAKTSAAEIATVGPAGEKAAVEVETSAATATEAETKLGNSASTTGTKLFRLASTAFILIEAYDQFKKIYDDATKNDAQRPGEGTPTDPTGQSGIRDRATGGSVNGSGGAFVQNDPIFSGDKGHGEGNGINFMAGPQGSSAFYGTYNTSDRRGVVPGGDGTTPNMTPLGPDPNLAPTPGPSDTPAGTASDPVQVQIPGFDPSSFDPSQFASTTASDMGIGADPTGMGGMGGNVTNPLTQLKGGGFTLANIAKVMTTFLMEMALGNPLGHLLTGTSMFGDGQDGAQGSTDATAQLGDIDKMTGQQRKAAEMELQMQSALAKYKKAQAEYIKIISKYGANSEQGISAYANLLSAKDNVEGLELRQTDSVAKANTAVATQQAKVNQDVTDQVNVSDPAKYQADVAKLKQLQDAVPAAGSSGGTNWDAIAGGGQYGPQESGGNWSNADTGGNGHFGGLQISPDTWKQFGGLAFGPRPDQASEADQKTVADRILNGWNDNGRVVPGQGSAAWTTWGKSGMPSVPEGGDGSATAPAVVPQATAPASGGGGGGGGGLFGFFNNLINGGGGGGGATAGPAANAPQGYLGAGGPAGTGLMPGANTTYTPDWMVQHGFPALYQRTNDASGNATNVPPQIQALAAAFGMTVNSHPDTTLHGGIAGKGNTLDPQGGWGFDFYGNEAQMAQLAQFEEQPGNIQNIAQLIHRSPGMDYGVAGGQNVGGVPGQSSYYTTGQGYNVHGDHDHIAFAQMPTLPGNNGYPAGYTDPKTWGIMPGAGGQGFLGGGMPQGPAPGAGGGPGASRVSVGNGNIASQNFGGPPTVSNTQQSTSPGSGSGFNVGGGMLGTAESLASSALNAIAPGAGIAAQIGMQELNNVASYIGKAAGIGVEGVQETLSVHSPDGDGASQGKQGWLGKIAGGLAGGHPQAQNSAGTAAPVNPQDQQKDPKQAGQGTTNNYNVTNNNHNIGDPGAVATKTNQSLMQYPTQ